ncbi:MAG: hypothetical protein OXN94_15980 [Chloroflexota bacterium]|nr:hypothetical protein [Chloroflexota bacterium]
MKKVHASRITVALIAAVLIWHYVDRRNDLQCYVMQLADMHEFVFEAGYASEDEIRDIVWNDTVAAFHGQAWRVKLDQVFHAIFMGGNRGQQVLNHLRNPPADPPEFICAGSINWSIWHDPDFTEYRHYYGEDIKSLHQVSIALQAIPPEELRHYEVSANLSYVRHSSHEGGSDWSSSYRYLGTVSARDWLEGAILPDYWAGWYESWLEQWKELSSSE